ncbi:MAG: cytochrome P450 [Gammaproteobacteria bacterium]
MSFSSHTFFSKPVQSLKDIIYNTFDWIYAHTPIPFTTPHDSRIAHLPGHPILGKIPVVAEKNGLSRLTADMYPKGKAAPSGISSVKFANETTYLLTKLSHVLQMLMLNNDNIDRGNLMLGFNSLLGDENVFSLISNTPEWRAKRKSIEPQLGSKQAVEKLIVPMQDILDGYVERLEEDGTIESLEVLMAEIAINIYLRTQFDSQPIDRESSARIFNTYNNALDAASDPWNIIRANIAHSKLGPILEILFNQYRVNAPLEKEQAKIDNALKDCFLKPNLDKNNNVLFNEELDKVLGSSFVRKENNDFENPFVARDENYAELESKIHDLSLLVLAAHETTSRTLLFIMCLLLNEKNAAVLAKFLEAIDKHAPQNGQWTLEDLKKMSFLDEIIEEAFRLYPTAPLLARIVTEDFVLMDIPVWKTRQEYEKFKDERDKTKDIIIPRGKAIHISPWAMHRDEDLFKDALSFKPERHHVAEDKESKENSASSDMLTFGRGLRRCPGEQFARQEIKLVILKLFQKLNWKILATVPKDKPKDRSCFGYLKSVFLGSNEDSAYSAPDDCLMRFTLRPTQDIRVKVMPREPRLEQESTLRRRV